LDLWPPADEAPAVPPSVGAGLPAGPPRPPHPGLFTAVLWCLLFLIVTQIIPGVVVLVGVFVVMLREGPSQAEAMRHILSPEGMNEVMRRAVMPSVALTQTVAVLFSLLVIRLVVGRDWTRRLALRRPRPAHVVLTVLALPAMVVLAAG